MKKIIFLIIATLLIQPMFAKAVANPASVYCTERGGKEDDGGRCRLPDKLPDFTICPIWDFYLGHCGNTYSLCQEKGYNRVNKNVDTNQGWTAQFAVCVDANKKECLEDDLKTEQCGLDTSLSATYGLDYKNFGQIADPANSEYVYRFWSPIFKSHFYTIDTTEAMRIKDTDSNWQYEGAAFKAYKTNQVGTVPIYRFWSPKFNKHFYTASQNEYNRLISSDSNWLFEKISFYAYPKTFSGVARDVYRFWSPSFGNSHFYTIDENEYQRVLNDKNWSLEDVGFRTPYYTS